ncbi:TPA: uracil-DNA glycosylase [Aeromonas veronii]|nr:uracil-DNA glycosylase [Aeromonas veronii]
MNKWDSFIDNEIANGSLKSVMPQVDNLRKTKTVYPDKDDVFKAFKLCPFDETKCVIIGQDPYHGGQAHGLSFSVTAGSCVPPSLRNIFKELYDDLGITQPSGTGDLSSWARQGVLLLNATLTVEAGEPNSHVHLGWDRFTDLVIQEIDAKLDSVVFILWGKFAESKSTLIKKSSHKILTAAHPSPFAAYRGFFGCKHFSQANDFLTHNGKTKIDWQL